MIRLPALLALLTLPALAGCATTASAPAAAASSAPIEPQKSAHDRLFELFKVSDEASLKRNPLSALQRGDPRYADQFGDYLSDAFFAEERAAAERDLATLRTIPRTGLNATDQLAFDVFEYGLQDDLRRLEPETVALTAVRPLNHFSGMHNDYATLSSGSGGAAFENVADYDNALKRHQGFVTFLDRAIDRFRQGQASGVVETKLTVRNMIEQLDGQLAHKAEDSPYYGPVTKFPASIGAGDQQRLRTEYREAIGGQIYPALRRLRDFLTTEYLPRAREGVGLLSMTGGNELYRKLAQSNTTLPVDPEEIHQLGVREVNRISAEMDKVRVEVAFKGNLQAFFDHLRNHPSFKEKSREALTERYYAAGRAVDAMIPRYFSAV
ncbi:MAG TPA: DUF885 domain-containing protein, partial [Sphingomicrobium sp.]